MTKDEELNQLREENTALRAQVAWLTERLSVLEAKPAKDSHNSHLPPSSDRFHRPRDTQRGTSKQAEKEKYVPLISCQDEGKRE